MRLCAWWVGKAAPHSRHTPHSVRCNCLVSTWILPCLQCSLLLEGYWPFWSVTILSCSHLWAQHHVVYSAEHIKLGVFPFFWDLMFGFRRKWRETKSSNPLRTQDLKKRHDSVLGHHLVLSHQPRPLTYTDMLLDARSGLAKWLACSEIMQGSPRITASCLRMRWEPGGRNASAVGQVLR